MLSSMLRSRWCCESYPSDARNPACFAKMRSMASDPRSIPNVARLGQWLKSWIQPSGAVHGFHNHTIWGENPYHYQEMSCGHTTFAAPVMVGLANALRSSPDARGERAVFARMIRYQVSSLQPDGQFDHIGYQIGDMCKVGLIHNATPAAVAGDGGTDSRGSAWSGVARRD